MNKQIELPIEREAEIGQVGLLVERYRTLCREYRRSDLIENFERQRRFRKEVFYEIRECREKLNELADTNNPEICFAIGLSHSMHIERDYDPVSAIKWFQKAADLGHLEAMVLLGGHFTRNDKFDDREKAAYWYKRAADAGNPSGMTRLGFAYREGSGVLQDLQKAVHWLEKATEHGELQCLVTAGRIYWHNLNQPEKALELFLRASDCGRRDSYLDLAMLYGDHETSLYSPKESIKWYWEALGNSGRYSSPRSLFALATYYRNGEGTGQNARKAKALLEELVELRQERNPFHQQAEEMLRDIEGSNP